MDILNNNDNNNNNDAHMADTNNSDNNNVNSSLNNNNRERDGINHERLRQLSNYADQNEDDDTWYWTDGGGANNPQYPAVGWARYRPLSDLSESDVERADIRVGESKMVSHINPERYEGTGISLDWGEYYVADDEMSSSDEESTLSEAEEIREEDAKEEQERVLSLALANTKIEQAPFAMKYDQLDSEVEAPTPTLMGMPDIILEKILHYSTDHPSKVCVVERVCKRFRRLTTSDDFWARKPFWLDKPHKYSLYSLDTREETFAVDGLWKIRKYQKSGLVHCNCPNSILDVLGDEGECVASTFRNLSANIISRMNQRGPEAHFRLRGDTIGYINELLQGYMIRILENALLLAIHSCYTTVKEDDIALAFRSQNDLFRPFSCGYSSRDPTQVGNIQMESNDSGLHLPSSSGIVWKWPSDNCHEVLPPEAGRRIIRRLAYKAGIIRMSNEAFILAEAELLHAFGVLLVCAYESSVEMAKTTQFLDEEKEVTYNEPTDSVDMFKFPPPFLVNGDLVIGSDSGRKRRQLVYTIVPGQIRAAAEDRDITPSNVYGVEWIASSGFTKEEEMAIEKSYYYEGEYTDTDIEGKESRLDDSSDSTDSEAEVEEGEEDSVMDMADYETSVYWDSNRDDRYISMLG